MSSVFSQDFGPSITKYRKVALKAPKNGAGLDTSYFRFSFPQNKGPGCHRCAAGDLERLRKGFLGSWKLIKNWVGQLGKVYYNYMSTSQNSLSQSLDNSVIFLF